jgi:TonB family protein
MSNETGTLIYIDEENSKEAEFMSRNFVNQETKNRAYINALGAELVSKYLATEGVKMSESYNIHSVSKILEKYDISDILLENIHIDVRVVFDKKQIFIPKSHFEYGLTPDIYVVLFLEEDFKSCELLGYFTPQIIDKKYENSQYYFISQQKLSSAEGLSKFVKTFSKGFSRRLSSDEILRGRELSVKLSDHNISEDEEKELLKLLLASEILRESVIEFDNFETLAYNSAKEIVHPIKDETQEVSPVILAEENSENQSEDEQNPQEETLDSSEEDVFDEEQEETELEPTDLDTTDEAEEITTVEDLDLSDTSLDNIDFDDDDDLTLDFDEEKVEETSEKEPTEEKSSDSNNIAGEIVGGAIAAGGALTAGGAVAGAISAAATQAVATEGAMKLAGLAGEVISDHVEQNIETQNENLNKNDFTQNLETFEEIPEEIASVLPELKINTGSEEEFAEPLDLNSLEKIELPENSTEDFTQETIDLGDMDVVEQSPIVENSEDTVQFQDIAPDMAKMPDENPEIKIPQEDESFDLSDFTTVESEPTSEESEGIQLEDFENLLADESNQDVEEFSLEEENEETPSEQEEQPVEEKFEEVDFDENVETLEAEPQEDSEQEVSENVEIEEPKKDLNEEFATDLNEEIEADEILPDENKNNEEDTIAEFIEEDKEEKLEDVATIPLELENSTVISDKTFQVGEISIDINNPQGQQVGSSEPLESLYNENSDAESSMLMTPGVTGKATYNDKKGLGLIGALVALVAVCVIGFGVAKMFKAPKEETPEPTTNDALPTNTVNEDNTASDALNVNPDDVVKMDNSADALVDKKVPSTNTVKATPTNNIDSSTKSAISATSYPEVKKLTWEVPDYVAYYPQFKKYFQTVGKSLKLSLTSDLLLATDFVYSKEVRVSVTFNKDGSFKNSQILKSSGSTQIDRIVLQTVNQTLNVLKAPSSVGNDESTTAILKIYF